MLLSEIIALLESAMLFYRGCTFGKDGLAVISDSTDDSSKGLDGIT